MTSELQARRLVTSRPCIEEIEGFLSATQVQVGRVSTEIMAIIAPYRADLMKGKVLPNPSRLPRCWVYTRGRKPTFDRKSQRRV